MKFSLEDVVASFVGLVIVAGLVFAITNRLSATPAEPNSILPAAESIDIEKGQVAWGRSLENAQAHSAKTGKPIFLLFQEIPG